MVSGLNIEQVPDMWSIMSIKKNYDMIIEIDVTLMYYTLSSYRDIHGKLSLIIGDSAVNMVPVWGMLVIVAMRCGHCCL